MKLEEMKALFTLAGIEVLTHWELPNQYWPEAYVDLRKANPWWLVKTKHGCVKIGWRKSVISINWEDTPIHQIITEDDVTKDEKMVHAWGYVKALTYLCNLAKYLRQLDQVEEKQDAS